MGTSAVEKKPNTGEARTRFWDAEMVCFIWERLPSTNVSRVDLEFIWFTVSPIGRAPVLGQNDFRRK